MSVERAKNYLEEKGYLGRVIEPEVSTATVELAAAALGVEPGRICVLDADCPDHVCMHRGWISDEREPIVCLPHQLVIEFTDETGDVDALTR